jgi:hypothetical protein
MSLEVFLISDEESSSSVLCIISRMSLHHPSSVNTTTTIPRPRVLHVRADSVLQMTASASVLDRFLKMIPKFLNTHIPYPLDLNWSAILTSTAENYKDCFGDEVRDINLIRVLRLNVILEIWKLRKGSTLETHWIETMYSSLRNSKCRILT